ncbi:MAG: hypothetical protein AABX29_09645 [Nanoarchaeota archaeon]
MAIEDKLADKARQRKSDQALRFRERNMSHLSAEEHLNSTGEPIKQYRQIHLSTELFYSRYAFLQEGLVRLAEHELALDAISRGCRYVTNLDYHTSEKSIIIVGRGLIKK